MLAAERDARAGFELRTAPSAACSTIRRSTTTLVDVIAQLDSVLAQLNSTNGTIGKLLRDDTLYTHMVAVTSQARFAACARSRAATARPAACSPTGAVRSAEQADDRPQRDPRRRAEESAEVHKGIGEGASSAADCCYRSAGIGAGSVAVTERNAKSGQRRARAAAAGSRSPRATPVGGFDALDSANSCSAVCW